MITKNKLKAEVVRLTYRVQDLEERLCPCAQHDFIKVDTEYEYNGMDVDAIEVRKCRRCGKISRRRW